ncbi:hypothetical protein [Empedobacter falsenii]|uniref:Uncharacterized protein n=1 Tax=Empedobacter falsenii TaxID=343874 RepID=A0A3R8TPI2_9FLAO|nr:hypothetical protein [Empedobacter falsenii]RRT91352.1 hypothetical protein EGI89_08955 [Empedobacter falsenii]RRT91411.1 hypothetical protein EGI88_08885 [Empedobacter falsenii]
MNNESLSDKLIEVTKKSFFYSGGIRYFDKNYSDYFYIDTEIDNEAEFYCKISNIEMALDILELTYNKLKINNFERDLTKGQFLSYLMRKNISPDSILYLNYIKTPSINI